VDAVFDGASRAEVAERMGQLQALGIPVHDLLVAGTSRRENFVERTEGALGDSGDVWDAFHAAWDAGTFGTNDVEGDLAGVFVGVAGDDAAAVGLVEDYLGWRADRGETAEEAVTELLNRIDGDPAREALVMSVLQQSGYGDLLEASTGVQFRSGEGEAAELGPTTLLASVAALDGPPEGLDAEQVAAVQAGLADGTITSWEDVDALGIDSQLLIDDAVTRLVAGREGLTLYAGNSTGDLDVATEADAAVRAGEGTVVALEGFTPRELEAILGTGAVEGLVLSGHGTAEGFTMQGEGGALIIVPHEEVATLLEGTDSLQGVLLNYCDSDTTQQLLADDAPTTFAYTDVVADTQEAIPLAVAFTHAIGEGFSPTDALQYAEGFYVDYILPTTSVDVSWRDEETLVSVDEGEGVVDTYAEYGLGYDGLLEELGQVDPIWYTVGLGPSYLTLPGGSPGPMGELALAASPWLRPVVAQRQTEEIEAQEAVVEAVVEGVSALQAAWHAWREARRVAAAPPMDEDVAAHLATWSDDPLVASVLGSVDVWEALGRADEQVTEGFDVQHPGWTAGITPDQALNAALLRLGTMRGDSQCLAFVSSMFGNRNPALNDGNPEQTALGQFQGLQSNEDVVQEEVGRTEIGAAMPPGAVVFFDDHDGGPGHVAIYTGATTEDGEPILITTWYGQEDEQHAGGQAPVRLATLSEIEGGHEGRTTAGYVVVGEDLESSVVVTVSAVGEVVSETPVEQIPVTGNGPELAALLAQSQDEVGTNLAPYDVFHSNQFDAGFPVGCGAGAAIMAARAFGLTDEQIAGGPVGDDAALYQAVRQLQGVGEGELASADQVFSSLIAMGVPLTPLADLVDGPIWQPVDGWETETIDGVLDEHLLPTVQDGAQLILLGRPNGDAWANENVTTVDHFVTVSGYDEATGEYIVNDPALDAPIRVSREQLAAFMVQNQNSSQLYAAVIHGSGGVAVAEEVMLPDDVTLRSDVAMLQRLDPQLAEAVQRVVAEEDDPVAWEDAVVAAQFLAGLSAPVDVVLGSDGPRLAVRATPPAPEGPAFTAYAFANALQQGLSDEEVQTLAFQLGLDGRAYGGPRAQHVGALAAQLDAEGRLAEGAAWLAQLNPVAVHEPAYRMAPSNPRIVPGARATLTADDVQDLFVGYLSIGALGRLAEELELALPDIPGRLAVIEAFVDELARIDGALAAVEATLRRELPEAFDDEGRPIPAEGAYTPLRLAEPSPAPLGTMSETEALQNLGLLDDEQLSGAIVIVLGVDPDAFSGSGGSRRSAFVDHLAGLSGGIDALELYLRTELPAGELIELGRA